MPVPDNPEHERTVMTQFKPPPLLIGTRRGGSGGSEIGESRVDVPCLVAAYAMSVPDMRYEARTAKAITINPQSPYSLYQELGCLGTDPLCHDVGLGSTDGVAESAELAAPPDNVSAGHHTANATRDEHQHRASQRGCERRACQDQARQSGCDRRSGECEQ
eukprot:54472-Rhodomonas_salina.4